MTVRRGALALCIALMPPVLACSSPPDEPIGLGSFPPAPNGPLPDDVAARLQAVFDEHTAQLAPIGAVASVIVAGEGTWTATSGTVDGEQPLPAEALFQIASTTKTFIAAQIMRLVERGELDLDDPITDHLPDEVAFFETNGATIRHLLSMQAGYPDERFPDGYGDPSHELTPADVLVHVPASEATPGTRHSYCNTCYFLLGLAVEEATGTSVARALRADVLADGRFATIVYQPEERPEPPLVVANPSLPGGAERIDAGGGYLMSKAEASAWGGSGAMAADAPTLALWGYELFGGRVVSDESLAAMTTVTDPGGGYTMGMYDLSERSSSYPEGMYGNGGLGSHGTVMAALPDRGAVIVVIVGQARTPELFAAALGEALT